LRSTDKIGIYVLLKGVNMTDEEKKSAMNKSADSGEEKKEENGEKEESGEKEEEKEEMTKKTETEEGSTEEKKEQETKQEEKEEPKEEKPVQNKEVTGKFKDLIEKIENLSVAELAELVKELEERFGVSAAAPVVAGGASSGAGGAGSAPAEEEKATYTIHLADAGSQKIAVIKAVREIVPDLGLKEAKDLVDAAPKDIKTDVPKEEAEKAKKKLEEAGAKIELK